MPQEVSQFYERAMGLLPTVPLGLTLVLFVWLVHRVYGLWWKLGQKYTLLEITPPAFQDKPIPATSALFSALHSLGSARTLREKIFGLRHSFSAEIVSSRNKGVRYIVRVPASKASAAKSAIKSYLSEAKIKESSDYINSDDFSVYTFSTKKNYAYPLKAHENLHEHDPAVYVAAAMNQLEDGEMMSLQLAFTPRKPHAAKRLYIRLWPTRPHGHY